MDSGYRGWLGLDGKRCMDRLDNPVYRNTAPYSQWHSNRNYGHMVPVSKVFWPVLRSICMDFQLSIPDRNSMVVGLDRRWLRNRMDSVRMGFFFRRNHVWYSRFRCIPPDTCIWRIRFRLTCIECWDRMGKDGKGFWASDKVWLVDLLRILTDRSIQQNPVRPYNRSVDHRDLEYSLRLLVL